MEHDNGEPSPPLREDEQALDDDAIMQIALNFTHRQLYGPHEIRQLLQSCRVYRYVLKQLFSYFHKSNPDEPFYISDSIRDRSIERLKKMASLEDKK